MRKGDEALGTSQPRPDAARAGAPWVLELRSGLLFTAWPKRRPLRLTATELAMVDHVRAFLQREHRAGRLPALAWVYPGEGETRITPARVSRDWLARRGTGYIIVSA
jgi:hypothetical protein